MYIAGGKDQFNMDAQVESFLYVAKQCGCASESMTRHAASTTGDRGEFFPSTPNGLAHSLMPYAQ